MTIIEGANPRVTGGRRRCVHDFVRRAYLEDWDKYLEYRSQGDLGLESAVTYLVRDSYNSLGGWGSTILDVGCGFGGHLEGLKFYSYFGIDLSLALLARHSLRGSLGVSLVVGDITRFHFDGLRYNFVIGALVLNYVEDLRSLLGQLRMEGVSFCFVLPNPEFDQALGVVSDGVVHLELGQGMSFAYYNHTVDYLLDAIQPALDLKIKMSPLAEGFSLPAYVSVFGRW